MLAVALLAGCGAPPRPASFADAERGGRVSVEGIPAPGAVRRVGAVTRLSLREAATGRHLEVEVPRGVAVPANLPAAVSVVVTGSYDAKAKVFRAEAVRTRVPNRDHQPRG